MRPQRPRRSLHTSHPALRAGMFGLAALASMSAAATVPSPPALDKLQIQRLAYPGGAVPPEALAAMKSRLAPATPLPAEKVSTDAPTKSPSITATTATLADRTASEPVKAAAPAPGKSPEVEVPATADGMRAAITPSTGQSAGSSLMRSPAMNMVQIRDLAGMYFQSESGSPVEVGGSPSAMMAPETGPGGAAVAAVATTAERQVSGPVAEVPSADEAKARPQVATIRPDAIRELAGAYVGHDPVQAAMSPQSPVARVERPADVAAVPGVPPAPAGQAAVSTPMQQAMTSGSSAAAAKSQLPVGQPAPADPGLIEPPVSSGDETRADAAQASAALPRPDESSSDGNSGHRALPQAQLDTLINVFAPELRD